MGQPTIKSDRVGSRFALLVDRGKNGTVTAGRLPATGDRRWTSPIGWGFPKGPDSGVLVRIEYQPGPAGPEEVEAYAITGDLAVQVPLMPDGDGVTPARVVVHRRDGRPPTSTDFGKLGLRAVYDAILEALRDPAAVEHLGARWGAVKVPRPGQRGRPELFYAKVALDYVRARRVAPATPIRHMVEAARAAGEEDVTEDELRARLRRARGRKLLTAAPRGRAGGELTAKARKLLAAAGLGEEGS